MMKLITDDSVIYYSWVVLSLETPSYSIERRMKLIRCRSIARDTIYYSIVVHHHTTGGTISYRLVRFRSPEEKTEAANRKNGEARGKLFYSADLTNRCVGVT